MTRRTYSIAGAALVAALCIGSAASARGACGAGWHRGPHGHCVRNVVRPATVVVQAATPSTTTIIYAPAGKPCPIGYHLGPHGRRCWPN